jgi:hypothetical protein
VTEPIDVRLLGERTEAELGRLAERPGWEGAVSIDRLEIGPLEPGADVGQVARAIADGVARVIVRRADPAAAAGPGGEGWRS